MEVVSHDCQNRQGSPFSQGAMTKTCLITTLATGLVITTALESLRNSNQDLFSFQCYGIEVG